MKSHKKEYKFNKRGFVASRRDQSGGCGKCITGGNITIQPFPILPHSNVVPNSNPDNKWAPHHSGLSAVTHGTATPVYNAQMAHRQQREVLIPPNLNQMNYPDYYATQGTSGADQKTLGMGWSSRENGLARIGHLPNGLGYNVRPRSGGVLIRGDQSVPPIYAPPPAIMGPYEPRYGQSGGMMGMGMHGRAASQFRSAKRVKYGGCAGNIACAPCAGKRGAGVGGAAAVAAEEGEENDMAESSAPLQSKTQMVEQLLFRKRPVKMGQNRQPRQAYHQLTSAFVYLPNAGENLAEKMLAQERQMEEQQAAIEEEDNDL